MPREKASSPRAPDPAKISRAALLSYKLILFFTA